MYRGVLHQMTLHKFSYLLGIFFFFFFYKQNPPILVKSLKRFLIMMHLSNICFQDVLWCIPLLTIYCKKVTCTPTFRVLTLNYGVCIVYNSFTFTNNVWLLCQLSISFSHCSNYIKVSNILVPCHITIRINFAHAHNLKVVYHDNGDNQRWGLKNVILSVL